MDDACLSNERLSDCCHIHFHDCICFNLGLTSGQKLFPLTLSAIVTRSNGTPFESNPQSLTFTFQRTRGSARLTRQLLSITSVNLRRSSSKSTGF